MGFLLEGRETLGAVWWLGAKLARQAGARRLWFGIELEGLLVDVGGNGIQL